MYVVIFFIETKMHLPEDKPFILGKLAAQVCNAADFPLFVCRVFSWGTPIEAGTLSKRKQNHVYLITLSFAKQCKYIFYVIRFCNDLAKKNKKKNIDKAKDKIVMVSRSERIFFSFTHQVFPNGYPSKHRSQALLNLTVQRSDLNFSYEKLALVSAWMCDTFWKCSAIPLLRS